MTQDDSGWALRGDVVAEPTVRGWYATAQCMSPATSAFLHKNSHMRLMEAYLQAPDLHFATARDPAMAGGAFVEVHPSGAGEVARLVEDAATRYPHLLRFVEEWTELERDLRSLTGGPLDDVNPRPGSGLYPWVTPAYDLQHRPTIMVDEFGLYRTSLYCRSAQSIRLTRLETDRRPFVMSTPRLDFDLQIDRPFDDPAVDRLLRSSRHPLGIDEVDDLADQLGVATRSLRSLLRRRSSERPVPSPFCGNGVRVTHIGHAGLLLESLGRVVAVDPVIAPKRWDSQSDRFGFVDLPAHIDAVLVTHAHQDHFDLETLLRLRECTDCVVVPRGGSSLQDLTLAGVLQHAGFNDVRELETYGELSIGADVAVTALPFVGEHGDLAIRGRSTYAIRMGSTQVVAAGDSWGDPDLAAELRRQIGPVESIFIGMESVGAPLTWGYGGLFSEAVPAAVDRSRRCRGSNETEGLAAIAAWKACSAFVYGMGQEPWMWHLLASDFPTESPQMRSAAAFVDGCRQRGITTDTLHGTSERILRATQR